MAAHDYDLSIDLNAVNHIGDQPLQQRACRDFRSRSELMGCRWIKEFKELDVELTAEQKKGRLDIRYRTAAGKHIIIELKRYKRNIEINDLLKQVRKYRTTLTKVLKTKLVNDQHLIEIIGVLGMPPDPERG